jgi:chemotaxis protein MotB
MSRKERLDSATAEQLKAMGVSTNPGRGWRILALLVVMGAATFLAAYYLPLYRAHGQLSTEYAKLSKAATSDRQKLADTVKTLQSVSNQRDELVSERRAADKEDSARAPRMSRVGRELEAKLSAASAKKLIHVEPQGGALNVLLTGSSLFTRNGAELSAAGKSLLCLVSNTAGSLRYDVRALATPSPPGTTRGAGLQTAAALAGSAAGTLADSCHVDPDEIVVRASTEQPKGSPSAPLWLRLEAASDDAEPASHRGPDG